MSDGIIDTAIGPVQAAARAALEPDQEPTPNANKLTARNLFKKRRLDEHNEAQRTGCSTPSTGSYVRSERKWVISEPSERIKRFHQQTSIPRPDGVPEGADLGMLGHIGDTSPRRQEVKKKREEEEKARKEENSRKAREMQEELQRQYDELPEEEKMQRAKRRAALLKRFDESWAKPLVVPKESTANGAKSSEAVDQGLQTKRPVDNVIDDLGASKRQRMDNALPGPVAIHSIHNIPQNNQPPKPLSHHSRGLSWGTDLDDVDERHDQIVQPVDQPLDLSTVFPPGFPPYRESKQINEIGTYISQARYVVSLGGPPLNDLGYGIIIVPFGEEKMLLSREEAPPINQSMMELIQAERYAHPPEEHHSFVGEGPRPRKTTSKEPVADTKVDKPTANGVPLPRRARAARRSAQIVPGDQDLPTDSESDDVNANKQLLSESRKEDDEEAPVEEDAPAPPASRRKASAKNKVLAPKKSASPPARRGGQVSRKASTPKPKGQAADAAPGTSGSVTMATRRTSARRGKK